MNYLGTWEGSVLLRYALANSMNVPSLQVLDGVGFDKAIDRAAKMLDMEDKKDDRNFFPRSFPLGLGVISVAPIDMARAYTTFANLGRPSDPLAITKVLGRNGEEIINPEKDRLRRIKHESKESDRIMSPQAAYLMIDLLKSTVEFGTLRWRRINVGGFDGMPMAGKTGTTQNWGDAWTIGFSPYYTTSVWFGFDTPGNSLGRELTGATAAGPTWAEYMKTIHQGLEPVEFEKPDSGLVKMRVCSTSGLLPTQYCNHTVEELFIAGTEPKQFCDIHPFERERDEVLVRKLQDSFMLEDFDIDVDEGPSLDEDILSDMDFGLDDWSTEDLDDEDDSEESIEDTVTGDNVNPLLE